jgi:hypothetical protein
MDMPLHCLEKKEPPFFHLLSIPDLNLLFENFESFNERDVFVARAQGSLKTKADILLSISEALSFPDYFGNNWDAFDECINDLEWLPYKGYILLLENGSDLLELPLNEWKLFFGVLEEATEFWKQEGKSFHVALVGSSLLSQKMKALINEPIHFH